MVKSIQNRPFLSRTAGSHDSGEYVFPAGCFPASKKQPTRSISALCCTTLDRNNTAVAKPSVPSLILSFFLSVGPLSPRLPWQFTTLERKKDRSGFVAHLYPDFRSRILVSSSPEELGVAGCYNPPPMCNARSALHRGISTEDTAYTRDGSCAELVGAVKPAKEVRTPDLPQGRRKLLPLNYKIIGTNLISIGMGKKTRYLGLELKMVGIDGFGTGTGLTGSGSNSKNVGTGLIDSGSNSENFGTGTGRRQIKPFPVSISSDQFQLQFQKSRNQCDQFQFHFPKPRIHQFQFQ
ncbi:hypothetical protein LXL04_031634 [Taraxacum kok-saghyz]